MKVLRKAWLASVAMALGATGLTGVAPATIPYTPVTTGAFGFGPGVVPVERVFGKEYSHDFDHDTTGAGGGADPQQIVAWDGLGGTTDGIDYSLTRPDWRPDQQIDAIANHNDAMFRQLLNNESHLIFTHDDEIAHLGRSPTGAPVLGLGAVPSAGPVLLANGNTIGGAGEVSIEESLAFSAPETQGLWASQSQVNGMPLPRDIDGLEVWGPEPAKDADADKYSLDLDFASGVSVWNGSGSAYIDHGTIVSAVESLLGAIPGPAILPFDNQESTNAINVDALMVWDRFGDSDTFDRDPTGDTNGMDQILFSIRQIVDLADPTGYYATGSELFLLDASGVASFFDHGGHVWDKSYALSSLSLPTFAANNIRAVIDINGIESVASVPEPAGVAMLGAVMAAIVAMRRRLG